MVPFCFLGDDLVPGDVVTDGHTQALEVEDATEAFDEGTPFS